MSATQMISVPDLDLEISGGDPVSKPSDKGGPGLQRFYFGPLGVSLV